MRFTDKVVLVTGGATGIGRAACLAFAREGAAVMIGDVDNRAESTVKDILDIGGEAEFLITDVTRPEQVKALVSNCVDRFGGLNCAFNNAGVLPNTNMLHEVSDEDFEKILAVDVKGVFYAMREQIGYMIKNSGGAIVNTASVAGVIADPGMSPYVAAKHAVVGLTKAAAIEYAAQGIRVNAIAPGLVATPMTQRWLDDENMRDILLAGSPIGRAAQPEEIVGTVLHLCSGESSFTNGQIAIIDGGQTAH